MRLYGVSFRLAASLAKGLSAVHASFEQSPARASISRDATILALGDMDTRWLSKAPTGYLHGGARLRARAGWCSAACLDR
jgi:hypothetical protein